MRRISAKNKDSGGTRSSQKAPPPKQQTCLVQEPISLLTLTNILRGKRGKQERAFAASAAKHNLPEQHLRDENGHFTPSGLKWLKDRKNLISLKDKDIDLIAIAQSHPDGLSAMDFSGVDLRGANLAGIRFFGANFEAADLSEADLRGADLKWANFRDTDLERALLQGADMQGACLTGANCRLANCCGTSLKDTDLKGVRSLHTLPSPNYFYHPQSFSSSLFFASYRPLHYLPTV